MERRHDGTRRESADAARASLKTLLNHPSISAAARAVGMALVPAIGDDLTCRVSDAELAEQCGLPKRAVRHAIDCLERRGSLARVYDNPDPARSAGRLIIARGGLADSARLLHLIRKADAS